MPQTLPLALNYWAGNQFMPAPVQWAPVPRRAVMSVLDAPTVSGMPSPAQSALGVAGAAGRGDTQGDRAGSVAQQNTREAKSVGDLVGAAATGFGMVSNPVGMVAGVLGNKDQYSMRDALPGAGLVNAGRGLAGFLSDAFGFGGNAVSFDSPMQGPMQDGMTVDQALQGPTMEGPPIGSSDFGPGGGFGEYSPEAQAAAERGGYEGSGMYAKGGTVNALIGPDPPGPDDGFGALDRGEYVVRAAAAKRHRGLLEAINRGATKKELRGLLG